MASNGGHFHEAENKPDCSPFPAILTVYGPLDACWQPVRNDRPMGIGAMEINSWQPVRNDRPLGIGAMEINNWQPVRDDRPMGIGADGDKQIVLNNLLQ